MWEPQRAALAAFDVVTPNLYALDGSTMDAWAKSLLNEVEGELVVAGASMGGYLALAVARRAPERVRGLVLVGSRADDDTPERRAARAASIATIRGGGAPAFWEEMRPRLLTPDAEAAVVDRAREIALAQDPDGLVRAVEAIRDRADLTAVLTELGDRSAAIVGDADPLLGDHRPPAGDVVVLAGAGHLPNLERPDEVNALLERKVRAWT
jgi:pimeloyl-ACP methyl ester carboxylesterase